MRRLQELLLPKKFPSPLTLLRHESEAESQNFSPPQSHEGTVNFGFEPMSCQYLGDKVLPHASFCPFQTGNDNADQAERSDLQSTVTQRLSWPLFAYVPIHAALTATVCECYTTPAYMHFARALYTQPFHPGATQQLQRAAARFLHHLHPCKRALTGATAQGHCAQTQSHQQHSTDHLHPAKHTKGSGYFTTFQLCRHLKKKNR